MLNLLNIDYNMNYFNIDCWKGEVSGHSDIDRFIVNMEVNSKGNLSDWLVLRSQILFSGIQILLEKNVRLEICRLKLIKMLFLDYIRLISEGFFQLLIWT